MRDSAKPDPCTSTCTRTHSSHLHLQRPARMHAADVRTRWHVRGVLAGCAAPVLQGGMRGGAHRPHPARCVAAGVTAAASRECQPRTQQNTSRTGRQHSTARAAQHAQMFKAAGGRAMKNAVARRSVAGEYSVSSTTSSRVAASSHAVLVSMVVMSSNSSGCFTSKSCA
jgi:hypothetical protein